MAYTKRGSMKRTLDRAVAAQEKSAGYLLQLREIYDPDYANYVEAIDRLLELHAVLIELLRVFRRQI